MTRSCAAPLRASALLAFVMVGALSGRPGEAWSADAGPAGDTRPTPATAPPAPPKAAEGVLGVTVEDTGLGLVVRRVLPASPAAAAGIQAGDRITEVDGSDVSALRVGPAVARISGAPGTPVDLLVHPPDGGPPRRVRVTRAERAVVEAAAPVAPVPGTGAYQDFVAVVRGPRLDGILPALEDLIRARLGGVEPRVVVRFTGQTLVARRTPEALEVARQVARRMEESHPSDAAVKVEAIEQLLLLAGDPAGALAAAEALALQGEESGPASAMAVQAAWDLAARAAERAGLAERRSLALRRSAEVRRPGLAWVDPTGKAQATWHEVLLSPDRTRPAVDALLASGDRAAASAIASRYLDLVEDATFRDGWAASGLTLPEAVATPAWEVTGAPAPAIDLATLAGGRFRLSEQRGHPVLVVFWASWCGPCLKELPHLQELYTRLEPQGLRMVGLAVQDDPTKSRQVMEKGGYTFPAATCPAELQKAFGVGPIPATRLLDGAGTIRLARKGYSEEGVAELAANAQALLQPDPTGGGAPLARIRTGDRGFSLSSFVPDASAFSVAGSRSRKGPDSVWLGSNAMAPRPLILGDPDTLAGSEVPRPATPWLAVGDADGDGLAEALAAGKSATWARVFSRDGTPSVLLHGPDPITAVGAADFDGDGRDEWLVAVWRDGRGFVRVADASGRLLREHPTEHPVTALATARRPGGDGVAAASGPRVLWLGRNDFEGPGVVSPAAGSGAAVTGDGRVAVSGSTAVAIAAGRDGAAQWCSVLRSDGALLLFTEADGLIQRAQLAVPGTGLAAADLQGDGSDELVVAMPGSGFVVLRVALPPQESAPNR